MSVEIDINVFTLNCWGIPGISSNRKIRMNAIAEELAVGKYDIVCLQEVWSENDYMHIKKATQSVLPYTHYFYSGMFGSGVCIFSKYVIQNVFFHQWPVNGYVHKLYHGDWFGGKGIGLCKVKCQGFSINIYSAHLHAEYNRGNDEYMAHRVLQAFDMSQFISMTSANTDIVILGGDLNTQPGDLTYRVIRHNAQLHDSFLQAQQVSADCAGTNDSSRNSYTDKKLCLQNPAGNRIDYVMYKSRPGIEVQCLRYQFPLPEQVPEQNFSYSDHEGLQVSLKVIKTSNVCEDRAVDKAEHMNALQESGAVCNAALEQLKQDRWSYWLYTAALFLTLLCTVGSESPFSYFKTYNIIRIIVTIMLCYTMFMAGMWNRMEVNAVLTGKLALEVVLSSMEDCNSVHRPSVSS